MKYLHTMVRISNIEESLQFYSQILGMKEIRRYDNDKGRFTLIFLAAPDDADSAKEDIPPLLELTYNWDSENYTSGRNFGHLAFAVDNIYDFCNHLIAKGVRLIVLQKMVEWPLLNPQMAFQLNCYKKARP